MSRKKLMCPIFFVPYCIVPLYYCVGGTDRVPAGPITKNSTLGYFLWGRMSLKRDSTSA